MNNQILKLLILVLFIPLIQVNSSIKVAGDGVSNAIDLSLNSIVLGSIPGTDPNEDEWFNISINTPDFYSINVTSDNNTDCDFNVYDMAGALIASSSSSGNMEFLTLHLTIQTYSIKVLTNSVSGSFTISVLSPKPGIVLSHALNLPLNTTVYGNLPFNYWYNASISSKGLYKFILNASPLTDFDLYIYNSSGSLLKSTNSLSYPETLFINLNSTGIYSLMIKSFIGSGSFSLLAKFGVPIGKSLVSALELPLGKILNDFGSSFESPSDFWYNVTITTIGDYWFNLTADTKTDFDLYIYSPEGTVVGSSASLSYPEELVLHIDKLGNYSLEVDFYSGSGSYYIATTHISPKPGINLYNADSLSPNIQVLNSFMYHNFWFNLTVILSDNYTITLNGDDGTDFNFNIYFENGTYFSGSFLKQYPENIYINLAPGVYSIRISDYGNTGGIFTLKASSDNPVSLTLSKPIEVAPINIVTNSIKSTPIGSFDGIIASLLILSFISLYSRRKQLKK